MWPAATAGHAWALTSPTAPSRTMPLTLGTGRTHLDMTSGYNRLYLGTHVSNSVGWTCTVQLGSTCDSSQGGLLTIRHARTRSGAMTGRRRLPVAPVTDRVTTCAHFYCHLQDQKDLPTEEKGGAALGLSSSLFFSLSLSPSCTLGPSLSL
jgi:hypothetical protein